MSNNPYQHITAATDKRLAEMITFVADHYSLKMTHEENETLREAARRLENYQLRETFNHEAFE